MADIVRIHMGTKEITRADAGKYNSYGSRGLIARLMMDEVDPACEPMGIYNKLIICTGLLGGTGTSCSGRLSVGGKSPLTNGIKEASSGGTAANDLARHGIRALVFEGLPQPEDKNSYLLLISEEGIELLECNELKYKLVSETIALLREKYGKRAGIICIGPSGEYLMRGAGVACAAPNGEMRFAARGGLGALMGVKQVKAVVVIPSKTSHVKFFDEDAYNAAAKEYQQMLIDALPAIEKSNRTYGTTGMFKIVNDLGLCPTKGFTAGAFEEHAQIGGEKLVELIRERGGEGKTGGGCINGCMIRCLSVFPDEEGKSVCSTIQYENLALLGSNLCLASMDSIARLNHRANDLGLDAIEIGAALGVAAQAGYAEFGSEESFQKLMDDVQSATPMGRILGNGLRVTGECFGINDLPMTKGQAFPGYDPRALKGNGVTFATTPMGGDHTLGNCYGARNQVAPLATEGQGDLSRNTQLKMAALENLGFCIFARGYLFKKPELFTQLVYGMCGDKLTVEEFWEQGRETSRLERQFNIGSGISPSQDRLPEYMYRVPLPPTGSVFDLSDEEVKKGICE